MLIKVFLNPAVLTNYIYFIKLLPILKSVPFTYALSPSYKSKHRYDNPIPIPYHIAPSTKYQQVIIQLSPKESKYYKQVGFKLLLPMFPIHIDAIIIACYFYFSTFFQFFIILMYVISIIMMSFELSTPT